MHRLCSPGVRRIVRGNARNPQANVRLAVGADGVFDEMRQEMGGRVGSISGHGLGFCEGQRGLDSVGCLRRAMFCWLVCGKNERNHLSIAPERGVGVQFWPYLVGYRVRAISTSKRHFVCDTRIWLMVTNRLFLAC